jgi:hypothetical protein
MSQVRVRNTKQKKKKKQTSTEKEKRKQKKRNGDRSEIKKAGQNKKMKLKKLSVVRYIILKIKIRFIFSLNQIFISKYPSVLWHVWTPYVCRLCGS